MTKPERCPTHLGCPTCGSDNRAHQNCLRLSLRTDSHKHHKCDLCSDPWHTPPPATAPELRIALVSQIAELEKQIAEVGSEPIEALQKRDELYAKLSALSPSPAPIQSAEQFWKDSGGAMPLPYWAAQFAETYAATKGQTMNFNPDLEKQTVNWQPISEYRTEFGRVIVWLQWPEYSAANNQMEHSGMWESAYRLVLNEGAVWVQAKDCIPIETTGRKVTHFIRPKPPSEDKK